MSDIKEEAKIYFQNIQIETEIINTININCINKAERKRLIKCKIEHKTTLRNLNKILNSSKFRIFYPNDIKINQFDEHLIIL